jgi:mersacidin/lichenicidin family type 2 lantibiotic
MQHKKGNLPMKLDIVRAWKDEAYRQSLSEEQLSTLPANPAGQLELAETDLLSVQGGSGLELLELLNHISVTSIALLSTMDKSSCVYGG